ncbi:MAG: hypothetical protein ACRC28_18690 [Clostridium sp.]|uniref:hypothetical protein n=1 Tax=Clostridium sp. TaxID=1506 RepID=UPI003F2A0076
MGIPQGRKGILTNLENEVIDARTGLFGYPNKSLNERLTKDFEDLAIQDNKYEYLTFSGKGTIDIPNSAEGGTKDLVIKGRTAMFKDGVEVSEWQEGVTLVSVGEENKISILNNEHFVPITSSAEQENNKVIIKSCNMNIIAQGDMESGAWGIQNATPVVAPNEIRCVDRYIELPNGFDYTKTYELMVNVEFSSNTNMGCYNSDKVLTPYSAKITNFTNGIARVKFEPNLKFFNFRCVTDVLPAKWRLIEDTKASKYEPYQEHKVEVQLPCPHREWNIYEGETGKYEENSGQKIIDGTEGFSLYVTNADTISFHSSGGAISPSGRTVKAISNKLLWNSKDFANTESFHINKGYLYLSILKSNLETHDVTGLKKLLKKWNDEGNPLKIVYQLETPIIHNIEKVCLNTYKDKTYITQENNIKSEMSCKAVVNVPKTIDSISKENDSLRNEYTNLKDKQVRLASTLKMMIEPTIIPDGDNSDLVEIIEELNSIIE